MLSAERVIAQLQNDFVNAWVLAKDLDGLAARGDADLAAVVKMVKANYGYPVDSVVIGSDSRLHGHVNVNEPGSFEPDHYLAFLRAALTAAGRQPTARVDTGAREQGPATPPRRQTRALVVAPDQPATSLLDTFRALGFGKPSMAFHALDTTAFADGGVLLLQIRVGSGAPAGRFELCVEEAGSPAGKDGRPTRRMKPIRTIDVARESTETVEHAFTKGQRFGLAVKPGPGSAEGDANAFLVDVAVKKR